MTKRKILLLSIFVTLVATLLIVVQVIWIGNTRETKQRDFRTAVSIALERVVDAVWREETIVAASNISDNSSNADTSLNNYAERQTSPEGVRLTSRSQEIIPYSKLDSFAIRNKSMHYLSDSGVMQFLKNTNEDPKSVLYSHPETRRILIEQVVERIFVVDLPIEQRITIEQIDTLMRNELHKSSINAPFEVAIISGQNELLMSSAHYSDESVNGIEYFQKQLFPNDPDFVDKYFLKVYFPKQDFYILQSLWIMIAVSVLLTLLVLVAFIATLMIITQQKKSAEIRNAFVSNLTHEFKTPIATISLASQMLQDKNISEEARNNPHLIQMVSTQSKKLTFLVEQILQMSIFNKGDYELKKIALNIHDIIHKILSSMSLQLKERNAEIICNLDAHNAFIVADDMHFTNIISNLLDNALKYSREIPKIRIATLNKDNGILVSISDNGIGISKEYQKRIFEQFFRVPSGNVHNVKGFGLGLSYVKKVIDVMGGKIWVHSEPERGSTFFVWIPQKNK